MNHRQAIKRWLAMELAILGACIFLAPAASAETWKRIGSGGFDGPYRLPLGEPRAMCVFKGKLHVGVGNRLTVSIWGYDGKKWTQVWKPNVTEPKTVRIDALAVFNDKLYVSAYLSDDSAGIWSSDGSGGPPYKWIKISSQRDVGDPRNDSIPSMAVAQGYLWAGTSNWRSGCEVWKYTGSVWTQAIGQGAYKTPTGPGFGYAENGTASAMTVSTAGYVYVGTWRRRGGEVWRLGGSQPELINYPGFMRSKNDCIAVLAFYDSSLYAVTEGLGHGCWIWKFLGPRPEDWKLVNDNGGGERGNVKARAAAVFGSPACLYLFFDNANEGCKVMRYDGEKWERTSAGGFGDPFVREAGALQVFGGRLYAAAGGESGGQIYATSGGKKAPHDWTLQNETGFTANANETASCSAFFEGSLYIGTENWEGCEIWRRQGSKWARMAEKGFGDKNNYKATSMAADAGALYVGTANDETGCEVWKFDGTSWTQINRNGFKDRRTSKAASMIMFDGKLHVGTESSQTRARIWRFDGPASSQWTMISKANEGVSRSNSASSMAIFNGKLFVGASEGPPCRVWRYNGPALGTWTSMSEEGFGARINRVIFGLSVYNGNLYAGTYNEGKFGGELWRSDGAGMNWTKATHGGFGNVKNSAIKSLIVVSNTLYASTSNEATGGEIWSYDGTGWHKANKGGFGKSKNFEIGTMASDGRSLIAGTSNPWQGCEIWVAGAAAAALSSDEADSTQEN